MLNNTTQANRGGAKPECRFSQDFMHVWNCLASCRDFWILHLGWN